MPKRDRSKEDLIDGFFNTLETKQRLDGIWGNPKPDTKSDVKDKPYDFGGYTSSTQPTTWSASDVVWAVILVVWAIGLVVSIIGLSLGTEWGEAGMNLFCLVPIVIAMLGGLFVR